MISLGATWMHLGGLFTNAGGGWEYPALLSVVTVVQALLGPGAFALNSLHRACNYAVAANAS